MANASFQPSRTRADGARVRKVRNSRPVRPRRQRRYRRNSSVAAKQALRSTAPRAMPDTDQASPCSTALLSTLMCHASTREADNRRVRLSARCSTCLWSENARIARRSISPAIPSPSALRRAWRCQVHEGRDFMGPARPHAAMGRSAPLARSNSRSAPRTSSLVLAEETRRSRQVAQ